MLKLWKQVPLQKGLNNTFLARLSIFRFLFIHPERQLLKALKFVVWTIEVASVINLSEALGRAAAIEAIMEEETAHLTKH